MNKDFIFKLASKLSEALPNQVGVLKSDFEKTCQQVLASTFNKLELVTRQEFDIQTNVLLRTRKQIEALEALVKEMELKLNKHSTPHDQKDK